MVQMLGTPCSSISEPASVSSQIPPSQLQPSPGPPRLEISAYIQTIPILPISQAFLPSSLRGPHKILPPLLPKQGPHTILHTTCMTPHLMSQDCTPRMKHRCKTSRCQESQETRGVGRERNTEVDGDNKTRRQKIRDPETQTAASNSHVPEPGVQILAQGISHLPTGHATEKPR